MTLLSSVAFLEVRKFLKYGVLKVVQGRKHIFKIGYHIIPMGHYCFRYYVKTLEAPKLVLEESCILVHTFQHLRSQDSWLCSFKQNFITCFLFSFQYQLNTPHLTFHIPFHYQIDSLCFFYYCCYMYMSLHVWMYACIHICMHMRMYIKYKHMTYRVYFCCFPVYNFKAAHFVLDKQ